MIVAPGFQEVAVHLYEEQGLLEVEEIWDRAEPTSRSRLCWRGFGR